MSVSYEFKIMILRKTLILKKYYTNYFENEKIIPNQNYQLCYADSLYKDGIKDEDMKKILGTLFNIDLKEILILDDFSNIIRASTYDYMDLSNSVNNKIEKLISKPENIDSIFIQYFFQYSIFFYNIHHKLN